MKNVLFVAALLLGLQSFAQQSYQLKGKVSREGEVLPNVNVQVVGTGQGTVTNLYGEYQLILQEGNYEISFTYGNTKTIEVNLIANQTLDVTLDKSEEALEEVFLSSIRVDADSPITFSNLSNKEIEERNLGQDIPVLMNYLPSVVTTTDAGNGVGYTSLRVRGSDATRTNVTINGIPYNDAESQGSFWVNLGDIASSVENIQLQRGVGTSTNGAGAFGASLNILTDRYSEEAYAEVSNSYGSYNTHKHTAKFSTGLFNDHWEFAGRASLIKSDGYIDRAESELKSYFLQGAYVNNNTLVKALAFGGKERTYQAWYGIDGDQLKEDRKYNPAGEYTDENGNVKYYDNQTDNYQQDHYQLLWDQKYDRNWSSNVGLHYTYGRGYYEEYQEDAVLGEYGLPDFTANGEDVTTSDLVNRSWLDNHFYGVTFNGTYQDEKMEFILGGGINKYEGDHFGEVIYTRFAQNNDPYEDYYFNVAEKTDFNIYGKATVAVIENLKAFGDLQLRTINYTTEGPLEEGVELPVDDSFTFFNPKVGLNYKLDIASQLYASVAVAHREPTRTDYENALFNGADQPEEEKLTDYEFGYRLKKEKFQVNANLYFMNYKNQLVLTGEIDDEGAAVRENSGDSYRLGIEVEASVQLLEKLSIHPNVALSRNKNRNFNTQFDGELQDFGDTDISFSPEVVAGNRISYSPINGLQLNWLSKFVGEQYMSNIESRASLLESYFINDLNVQYVWKKAPLFKEVVFTGLVNNIFDVEYISNGYYFSYDDDSSNPGTVTTIEGAGYYPQATINFLAGITLKF
ncbi:iron complex outermembrane receptor protein [Mesonia algae]|uniref:Iron complex outermembrane receptor protein n=1 Tax=Mesonia algae TaxID=213248 RepID=A0A2W7IZ27_9FLAO|nr:TonB-dependent receptor [Mesonia algae]PZW43923.1 iron complex outermembrane receptor protein [Mesonia algae]